ncbi:hypothetical protein [Streptomyces zagrosensis]|uniref:Uncharacterized protein n=1 Tax=Streptomyces zagrosensis TaxID=1042984 RepID=A0A7W9QC01_9ACTN|nr:hypothetical protein [Streptomyces zagrosensis]MBB5936432.1 hypothetical protein [Streptomyces zagrosensis]
MRNLIGHAYAMNWLADNGWPALRAIRAYSDEHRTKLANNGNVTWNLPDPRNGRDSATRVCGRGRREAAQAATRRVVEFEARATAQNFTPHVAQRLAEENTAIRHALAKAKGELAVERERVRALARATAELSLELDQTREELATAQQVTRLPGFRA